MCATFTQTYEGNQILEVLQPFCDAHLELERKHAKSLKRGMKSVLGELAGEKGKKGRTRKKGEKK